VYLVVLSTTTLPLYSLTVHMGSDYKRALLPRDICARLDAAADEVRGWCRQHRRGGVPWQPTEWTLQHTAVSSCEVTGSPVKELGSRIRVDQNMYHGACQFATGACVRGRQRAREDTAEKKKKLRSLISGVFPYMRREAPREGHAHLALTLPPAPRAPQDASRRAAAPAEA
jgi:hypothetical protein